MPPILQPALQRQTLRLYGELLCRGDHWGGKLVLAAFPGASATGLPAAASLAGAASLIVDSDTDSMKAHFRDGAFDFIVNSLDEAIRALKNEIRQARPIAIGLMGDPDAVLAEAAGRGLAASFGLTASTEPLPPAVMEKGAASVSLSEQSPELDLWLREKQWLPIEISSAKQTTQAEGAVVMEPSRERWWNDLPAYQRSIRGAGSRWVWGLSWLNHDNP